MSNKQKANLNNLFLGGKIILGTVCIIFAHIFLLKVVFRLIVEIKSTPATYFFPDKRSNSLSDIKLVITSPKIVEKKYTSTSILKDAEGKTTWTEPYTKMQFQRVSGGRFIIGNNKSIPSKDDRELVIDGFWMGVYEVTVGQFRQFVKETGHKTASGDRCKKNTGWKDATFKQTEKHPVACVSWLDVQAYIRWLNSKSTKKFRLPS
ncbi:MAG: SUMF1/EgtB/PvdO family nonheme iron enzyme, partial [Methylococcaceae bacterium]|nr:SUMF1/EgtB/PvdO family nonheme iron enzyme [Methylococcaceae bacterium]